jgi:hypothetical protein
MQDSLGSRKDPVTSPCEHSNESFISINYKEFSGHISDYHLLRRTAFQGIEYSHKIFYEDGDLGLETLLHEPPEDVCNEHTKRVGWVNLYEI